MFLESTSALVQQFAFGLLILLLGGVTLGVGYLTVSDWRDRKRRKQSSPSRK
ncbi:MAG: hypothetical protein AB4050_07185 [Synechococcus sp.]